jgi:hypothetical protein
VRVEGRESRGRIVIEFGSTDDLARIWSAITGRNSRSVTDGLDREQPTRYETSSPVAAAEGTV